MKQNTHSKAKRRALLGAISTAGVVGAAKLPGQWTRPVVDHVLLPAHAATTNDTVATSAAGADVTSVSTFMTTVTSNCVVTCTSAGILGLDHSTAIEGGWVVNRTFYFPYIQCSDSLGGFTSAFTSSSSYSFTNPVTSFTSFYSSSGSASYTSTSNGICIVTATSS